MTHHRTSTVALALCLVSLGTLACDDKATPAPKAEGPKTAASTAATTTAPEKKDAPTPKKAADTQTLNGTVKVGSEDVAVAQGHQSRRRHGPRLVEHSTRQG